MDKQQTMIGKVCLITGATSGIGKVTALALAKLGATVIVGGRNAEKCIKTVQEIQEQSENQAVEYILADMSSLQDVRKMAATFLERHQQLHVLINNAGATYFSHKSSADGHELTFATNYLGPFLLTDLLLETLKASAPARIINASSLAHKWSKFDISNPQKESGIHAYNDSKFALILFTYELARRLQGTNVTATVFDPGYVKTNITRNNGLAGRIIMALSDFFNHAVSPEVGAQTMIYLATAAEVANVSGKYYANVEMAPSAKETYDEAWAKQLWTMSQELIIPAP